MKRVLCGLAFMMAACAHAQPVATDRSGFVDAITVVPGLVVDMRYYGSENFVGRRIAGYEAPVCLLTKDAAAGLGKLRWPRMETKKTLSI